MQTIRKFKIKKIQKVADDLCRIWLTPADDEPVFEFAAGQFAMIHILDEKGGSKLMRPYSLASAPSESREQIELGVKSQGKMSQVLCAAKEGDIFGVQGPYGQFILNKGASKIVFFAGGVGMTPFRAHIRESLNLRLNQKMILFYSGGTRKDLMYHAEFIELSNQNENFKYIPILTRECPKDWAGECNRLNRDMVERNAKDFMDGEFMMCGPGMFMENVKEILENLGVDVKSKLQAERY
ncbi:MAG: ferredoxin--NADP reductase [Patescibacteria group bacterium]